MINSFKIGGCPQILHPHGSPWAIKGSPIPPPRPPGILVLRDLGCKRG